MRGRGGGAGGGGGQCGQPGGGGGGDRRQQGRGGGGRRWRGGGGRGGHGETGAGNYEGFPPPDPLPAGEGVDDGAAALALAREALIAANPEAVPELIAGSTAEELRASLAAAKAAYARIAETVRARLV